MKTFIKIILIILLPIFLLFITMSFIIENILINTISNDMLQEKVSEYVIDEVINEVDDETVNEIVQKLDESQYIDEITEKFLDLLSGEIDNIDIEEEVNRLLDEELKDEIPEDMKEEVRSYVAERSDDIEEVIELVTENTYVSETLNLFGKFISFEFRIGAIILCLIDMIILAILEKHYALKSISIILFVVAFISILVFIAINALSMFIKQYLSGGLIVNINVDTLIGCIIAEVVIACILLIIKKVIDRKIDTIETEEK